jgi:HK97 family phage portal protein
VSVYPSLDEESLVYKVTRKNGNIDTLDGSDVIHVPCIALDGVAGLSPISQNRQAIGLALAAEAAGASFFGNGSRPSGYLSLETALKPDQREELEKKWNAAYGGAKNTGKVPVLSGGLKWQQLAISPSDAQYIESREFQIADIARIFRVPAVLIGLADKSATYASAEQFFLAFVKFTLSPWIQAIEQEFNRKLVSWSR